jgi:hypothetical protein
MKKISVKTLMVMTIISSSLFAMPIMSRAENGGGGGGSPMDPRKLGESFRGWGMGGEILADILELLFNQTVNFEDTKRLDGVYVLNATKQRTVNGTYDFAAKGDEMEIHMLPWQDNGTGDNYYNTTGLTGMPYCVVNKTGAFKYNLTIGASITFLIWDSDNSFIDVVVKIINFAKKVAATTTQDELISVLLGEGVSLISWIITHINDIFTGDELFVLNPITWQKFEMEPITGGPTPFNITKTWYTTGGEWWMDIGNDQTVDFQDPNKLGYWNGTAQVLKDSYMQWLLTKTEGQVAKVLWTHFQFEIIQFWMKNFEIHIDLGALGGLTQGGFNPANLFNGLDIEFYMFHHKLEAGYLYNDINGDDQITVTYEPQTYDNGNGTEILIDPETGQIDQVSGVPILRPNTTEITHQFMLGSVLDFQPQAPTKLDENSLEWGLRLDNATIRPVPVGVDLNSYLGAKDEELDYIDFKLKFTKDVGALVGGTKSLNGTIKLQHNFAPWNDNENPYVMNTEIATNELDLAIVYITNVLHFHLNVQTKNEANTAQSDLPPEYESVNKGINIGNYIIGTGELELVDIAGPNYLLGNATAAGVPAVTTSHPASSSFVPVGLATFEGEKKGVHTGDKNDTTDDFSSDITLDIEINRLYYAVHYPEFNGTGKGIWHDPTFNVYMVFSPEAAGFWALILLVAGIGLVGIATIMIKKKKDREGF